VGRLDSSRLAAIDYAQQWSPEADLAIAVKTCFDILKLGGFILCLNHNVEALSARLMKERSPIIDIEHTYLYSPGTIRRLFTRFGFQVKETGGVENRYSLSYLTRLCARNPKENRTDHFGFHIPATSAIACFLGQSVHDRAEAFLIDKDASGNAGNLFTHTNRLSCRLANQSHHRYHS
jgi:hypothetical protein